MNEGLNNMVTMDAASGRGDRLLVPKAVVCLLVVPLAGSCSPEPGAGLAIPSNDVVSVAVGANGAVWVGTRDSIGTPYPSLARLHKGDWQAFTKENSKLPHNDVRSVAVAPNGAVWIGTWPVLTGRGHGIAGEKRGGLARLHEGHWQVFRGKLPFNRVSSLAVASDGALWAGAGRGLARLRRGDWRLFTKEGQ